MNRLVYAVCMIASLIVATPSYAYLGPGLGAGTLAATLSVITAIFLALIAIIYYPIKRAFNSRKKKMKRDFSEDQAKVDQ